MRVVRRGFFDVGWKWWMGLVRAGDGRRWMLVMWMWEEKKGCGRRDSGTATFLYERAAKRRAACDCGLQARRSTALSPIQPNQHRACAKAHNQTRCCCVAPRDFLSQLPAPNTLPCSFLSSSRPSIHHDTSINRHPHPPQLPNPPPKPPHLPKSIKMTGGKSGGKASGTKTNAQS